MGTSEVGPPNLKTVIDTLIRAYGLPEPQYVTDPFEMILFENVVYLFSDEYRVTAIENLRNVIGLRPVDILTATPEQFDEVEKSSRRLSTP